MNVGAVWLVLSNAVLVPVVILAWWRSLWLESSHAFALMIASSLYHVCDTGGGCLGVGFNALRSIDFFFAYLTVFIVALTLGRVPLRFKIFLYISCIPPILALVLGERFNHHDVREHFARITPVFVISVTVVTVLLAHVLALGRNLSKIDWPDAFMAGFLTLGAVVARAHEDGDSYAIFHGLWHLLLFAALYFVVEVESRQTYLLFFTRSAPRHAAPLPQPLVRPVPPRRPPPWYPAPYYHPLHTPIQ